jgi:hypothetical protein
MGRPPFDIAAAEETVSRIQSLLVGHADRRDEAEILRLLRGAGPAELDHVIARLDLSWLLAGMDDRLLGPDNCAALLALLCEERLADLSAQARAALIGALQKGHTCRADERAIHRVFLGTFGAMLTDLKNAIDGGGTESGRGEDHHDLQQLVFRDIDDDELREEILTHIQREAVPRADLKILSDIDDTLYRNWKDPRYPGGRHPVTKKRYLYPGVRAFYRELDVAFPPGGLGDLTFLTARPGDRAGFGEGVTRKHLDEVGLSFAKVLTGDFAHLATNELIAEKKYAGFAQYRRLFPEYRFVFCGDSGQGDAIAGRRMMEHPAGGMLAVFIHDVVFTSAEERAAFRAGGVHFNDTYAGAAADAVALGLLDLAAARRIAAEAVAEMHDIPFEDAAQRDARWVELHRDADRLERLGG